MSDGMAKGQLAGSPGLGMPQPWTKLTSIYVGTHTVKIFLQVSYNWESASATSASRSRVLKQVFGLQKRELWEGKY